MGALRVIAWAGFCLFVAVSWAALGVYALGAGQGPCEESGTCSADYAVAIVTLLLMPAQVLMFVWLRQRWDENDS